MRTIQHVVDTKAVRQVLNNIPEHCVIRELSERDYGIDLMLELFKPNGVDKDGNDIYNSTGHVCYLQLKGTGSDLKINPNKTISYCIDKKSLFNVEKFATPFILTRVYTNFAGKPIYFVWLQRYISEVLDVENPSWRTDDSESITIYIPIQNNLSTNFEKIEKIASRIKYIEELSEYCEKYADIKIALNTIIESKGNCDFYPQLLVELHRLTKLSTLLSSNNCCIDKASILSLISYIESISDNIQIPNELDDFPHNYNLDLLSTSNLSSIFIENFVAENEGNTVY